MRMQSWELWADYLRWMSVGSEGIARDIEGVVVLERDKDRRQYW